jgi:uncharacterized membrane protein
MVVIQVLGDLSLQNEVIVIELLHNVVVLVVRFKFSAKIALFSETLSIFAENIYVNV